MSIPTKLQHACQHWESLIFSTDDNPIFVVSRTHLFYTATHEYMICWYCLTRGYPLLQVMPQLPLQLVEGGDTPGHRAGFWESMWCLTTPAWIRILFAASFGIPTGYPENSLNQKIPNRLLRSFIRVDATVVQDWKQETTGQDRQDGTTSGYGGWGRMEYGQNMVSIWSHFADFVTRQFNAIQLCTGWCSSNITRCWLPWKNPRNQWNSQPDGWSNPKSACVCSWSSFQRTAVRMQCGFQ